MTQIMKLIPLQHLRHLGVLSIAIAVSLASMIASCGGGGSTAAILPGTGGTGQVAVTAQGPVSGFGSVIVNGIRFDDSQANVSIDGNAQLPKDLRLGMVASIAGNKFTAPITATAVVKARGDAKDIQVWSIAQGSISHIVSTNTFSLAGMTLSTNNGTVFEGFTDASLLTPTSVVKVWGQPTSSDFSQWSVTRLELLSNSAYTVITGKISVHGATPFVNGVALTGAISAANNGLVVRATGTLTSNATNQTMSVSNLSAIEDIGSSLASVGEAAIQGVVTSVNTTGAGSSAAVTSLMVGTTQVDMRAAKVSPLGSTISVGQYVEIEGAWNAGVLIARNATVQSEQQLQEVEIEGAIEQFTSAADFILRGQRCDATGQSGAATLRLGTRIHIHGLKHGNIVRVTELEIQ
jgi:Domain of unknown function (DUF5666)